MARDASKRPTPRARAKKQAASAPKAASRPSRATAPRQARRTSAPSVGSSPARRVTAKAQGPSALQTPKASSGRAAGALGALVSRLRGGGPSAAQAGRERRVQHQRGQVLRIVLLALGALLALGLAALVALFVLRDSPMFEITSVEVEPTEHVTVDDVANLVQVPAGSTLLNVDTAALEEQVRREPWVGSVSFERVFPGTLKIHITEQEPDMLVVMSSGSVGWYLGTAGSWIEPVRIAAAEGQSVDDAALALAEAEGCLLVTGVPSTVDPEASAQATDAVLDAIDQFRDGFSEEFSSQVVRYSAPSPENISCTLACGVEVSLGSPTDIEQKEAIVSGYLAQHPDSIISINVRVVSSPAYREIASENVQQGEGVTAGDAAAGEDGADGAEAPSGEETTSPEDEESAAEEPSGEGEAEGE